LAIHIEPLQKRHDRRAFSCGEPSLDDWFRHRARQDSRRDLAQVFVAIDDQLGLVGFYSLSAFSIGLGIPPAPVSWMVSTSPGNSGDEGQAGLSPSVWITNDEVAPPSE
jgi:hypothetical protein